MAKPKKESTADDLISELDGVVEEAGALPIVIRLGRGGGAKRTISKDLAVVLKRKYDIDSVAYPIPKVWLEEKLGYPTGGAIKGRPNQVKDGLNRQHGDLVGEGYIWHVGNHVGKFYVIAIVEVEPDEELKWKNPVEWKKQQELKKSEEEET